MIGLALIAAAPLFATPVAPLAGERLAMLVQRRPIVVAAGPTNTPVPPTSTPTPGDSNLVALDAFERSGPALGADWEHLTLAGLSNVGGIAGSSDMGGTLASLEAMVYWVGAGTLSGTEHYGCVQLATPPDGENQNPSVCLSVTDGATDDAVCCIAVENVFFMYAYDGGIANFNVDTDTVTWSAGDCVGIQRNGNDFECFRGTGPGCTTWNALGGGASTIANITSPGTGGSYLWQDATVSGDGLVEGWEMGNGELPTDRTCGVAP